MSNPDLIQSRDEVGLIDSLIAEKLMRLSANDRPILEAAREAFGRLQVAMKTKDLTASSAALDGLPKAFETSGRDDDVTRQQLADLIDLRRKLVIAEVKRVATLRHTMTLDQAMALVTALTSAIRDEVKDRGVLASIQARIAEILAVPERTEGPRAAGTQQVLRFRQNAAWRGVA